MMSLQALRTIEVHRANVEDLTEKGGSTVLLVRGKTRDRIAYLRPDMGRRVKEYRALRGTADTRMSTDDILALTRKETRATTRRK